LRSPFPEETRPPKQDPCSDGIGGNVLEKREKLCKNQVQHQEAPGQRKEEVSFAGNNGGKGVLKSREMPSGGGEKKGFLAR